MYQYPLPGMMMPMGQFPQQRGGRGRGRNNGGNRGKGAAQRRSDNFNSRMNNVVEDVRKETVSEKLKLKAPNFNFLSVPKVDAATVSITFYYLISYFLCDVWPAMIDKGARAFTTWLHEAIPGDANPSATRRRRIFKLFLRICEAKMWAAVRSKGEKPHDFTVAGRYTDEELRLLTSLLSRVPKPLAVVINAIGKFEVNEQPWLPQRPTRRVNDIPQSVFALMTMMPSLLTNSAIEWFTFNAFEPAMRTAVGIDMLEELFDIRWNAANVLSIQDAAKLKFGVLSNVIGSQMRYWNQAMNIQSERRSWCVNVDIEHGEGEPCQLVVSENEYTDWSAQTTFFSQIPLSEPMYGYGIAFGLGFTTFSCFNTDRHIGLGRSYSYSHLTDRMARLRVAIVASQADETTSS